MPSSPDSSSDSSTGSPGNHGNHYSDGPNPEVESCLPGVVSIYVDSEMNSLKAFFPYTLSLTKKFYGGFYLLILRSCHCILDTSLFFGKLQTWAVA